MIQSSSDDYSLAFLITAAGSGTRMGGGIKKEFRELNGLTVLETVIDNFIETGLFDYGVITCIPGSEDEVRSRLTGITDKLKTLRTPLLFCAGGRERQNSVHNGLKCIADSIPEMLENGIVLVHDGARPWADSELITRVVEGCIKHRACAPIMPSVDAMKEVNEAGIITGHLPRKETVSVQTPQGFAFNEILAAHGRAAADGRTYIDDTEIFSRYEGDVYTVEGSIRNRKITYSTDLDGAGR